MSIVKEYGSFIVACDLCDECMPAADSWNEALSKAQTFYTSHGVKSIAPAFELSPLENVPLMFTKHCLRYSMGWCPVHQKQKSPWKEPFYLMYKDTRLRLEFDCKHCQMLVFKDTNNKKVVKLSD